MKKLALALLTISCVYTSSHGMFAKHAHRARVFNQIKKSHHNIAKRFCSTNTVYKKPGIFRSSSFWFGIITGAIVYEYHAEIKKFKDDYSPMLYDKLSAYTKKEESKIPNTKKTVEQTQIIKKLNTQHSEQTEDQSK